MKENNDGNNHICQQINCAGKKKKRKQIVSTINSMLLPWKVQHIHIIFNMLQA